MELISPKLYQPTASAVRYVIHQGGTRSIKTYTIAYYLLYNVLYNPNTAITIVSELLPHIKRRGDTRPDEKEREKSLTFPGSPMGFIFIG